MDVESKYLGIPLRAVIDRIEGDVAVLRFEDSQEFSIARQSLVNGISEGSSVKVYILDDKIDQQRREDLAKSILNEVLGDAT